MKVDIDAVQTDQEIKESVLCTWVRKVDAMFSPEGNSFCDRKAEG